MQGFLCFGTEVASFRFRSDHVLLKAEVQRELEWITELKRFIGRYIRCCTMTSFEVMVRERKKSMNQTNISSLNPTKRKEFILERLSELTRRRDELEDEIKRLCRLWDETVSELNGIKTPEGSSISEEGTAGLPY